jgi:ribose/xylose/arabinose/galactoside ABC-type transport system permease subunit
MNGAPWSNWLRAIAGRPGSVHRPAAFLIIICLIATALSPAFLTVNNLTALLTSSSFLIVAAAGRCRCAPRAWRATR